MENVAQHLAAVVVARGESRPGPMPRAATGGEGVGVEQLDD